MHPKILAAEGTIKMISCTEFIPAYSELFKFLHSKGGKAAVVKFWESLSDSFLGQLRDLATKQGLAGCFEYPVGQRFNQMILFGQANGLLDRDIVSVWILPAQQGFEVNGGIALQIHYRLVNQL